MRHPIYILAAAAISPQHSFDNDFLLQPLAGSTDNQLMAVDIDYRRFINPVAIRRMSRLLKMSISAAMRCLQLAGLSHIDAIITGTSRGSVSDTEHFLKDMIALHEGTLNPTAFIQSTYNAPNGWIALQSKSTGYNQTYVHRGFSLELALTDAQLLAAEQEGHHHILVGCYDELSPEYYIVKDKLDYWKKEPINSPELLQHKNTQGTIAGEGSAFFCISDQPDNAVCVLNDVQMLHEPSGKTIKECVTNMLDAYNLSAADIDMVLCGKSGDSRFEHLYPEALVLFSSERIAIAGFKHLCGEFETSTGFALWLTTEIFKRQEIPDVIQISGAKPDRIKNILIINHYILDTASVLLLTAV
ncbi:beta-ketoacyl synthase chain length factor [Chitinophagaceae bacterium MMS25-I14]